MSEGEKINGIINPLRDIRKSKPSDHMHHSVIESVSLKRFVAEPLAPATALEVGSNFDERRIRRHAEERVKAVEEDIISELIVTAVVESVWDKKAEACVLNEFIDNIINDYSSQVLDEAYEEAYEEYVEDLELELEREKNCQNAIAAADEAQANFKKAKEVTATAMARMRDAEKAVTDASTISKEIQKTAKGEKRWERKAVAKADELAKKCEEAELGAQGASLLEEFERAVTNLVEGLSKQKTSESSVAEANEKTKRAVAALAVARAETNRAVTAEAVARAKSDEAAAARDAVHADVVADMEEKEIAEEKQKAAGAEAGVHASILANEEAKLKKEKENEQITAVAASEAMKAAKDKTNELERDKHLLRKRLLDALAKVKDRLKRHYNFFGWFSNRNVSFSWFHWQHNEYTSNSNPPTHTEPTVKPMNTPVPKEPPVLQEIDEKRDYNFFGWFSK